MLVIGIDCATEDTRIGLAVAHYHAGRASVGGVVQCSRTQSARDTIVEWIRTSNGPVLLAVDAPLGWPDPLRHALPAHQAGETLHGTSSELFRRTTDKFVQELLGKTPLDVGADRIARTAHAALQLLGSIRSDTGRPIPLAWAPNVSGICCLEVYPAATLVAHGFRSSGYKKREHTAERLEIARAIGGVIDIALHETALTGSADVLDAAVCVLAAKDFLDGRAMPPQTLELAKREGWIWVTGRKGSAAGAR